MKSISSSFMCVFGTACCLLIYILLKISKSLVPRNARAISKQLSTHCMSLYLLDISQSILSCAELDCYRNQGSHLEWLMELISHVSSTFSHQTFIIIIISLSSSSQSQYWLSKPCVRSILTSSCHSNEASLHQLSCILLCYVVTAAFNFTLS